MLQLKELRTKSNVTQLQIAEFLGVSRSTYTRYEIGEREPNVYMLKKIAAFFKISIDVLLQNNSEDDSLDSQIMYSVSDLNDDDKINLIRYIDYMKKRNRES